MLVFSPGFQETGRNFYEQADKLNKLGFDVILMDHQWSGQTKGGVDGTLDRGFGVARDVASVAAYASKLLEKTYANKSSKELILVGNSMGAGPGVLSAVTLNDNGKISLSGDQMPVGLRSVLQSPFLATTPSMINSSILAFSNVPFVKSLALYSSGLPILTHDSVAAQKGTQVALTEDIRAQLKTMVAANEDISFVIDMIKNGQTPNGKVSIIQADKDPLADSKKVIEVASRFSKDRVNLKMISSNNHVFEQSPTEQNYLIDNISKL
jgi:alpha-beta hydrolase superfamily lysophospholipase